MLCTGTKGSVSFFPPCFVVFIDYFGEWLFAHVFRIWVCFHSHFLIGCCCFILIPGACFCFHYCALLTWLVFFFLGQLTFSGLWLVEHSAFVMLPQYPSEWYLPLPAVILASSYLQHTRHCACWFSSGYVLPIESVTWIERSLVLRRTDYSVSNIMLKERMPMITFELRIEPASHKLRAVECILSATPTVLPKLYMCMLTILQFL